MIQWIYRDLQKVVGIRNVLLNIKTIRVQYHSFKNEDLLISISSVIAQSV